MGITTINHKKHTVYFSDNHPVYSGDLNRLNDYLKAGFENGDKTFYEAQPLIVESKPLAPEVIEVFKKNGIEIENGN